MKTKTKIGLAAVAASVLGLAGCAMMPGAAELDAQALAMMKGSFREQGIAKMDRLEQDLGQKACSSDQAPSDAVAKKIEAEAMASIKWPANGQYIGD